MWMAIFAMCETNTYLAHCWFQRDKSKKVLTHSEHKKELAMALLNNTHAQGPSKAPSRKSSSPSAQSIGLEDLCSHTSQYSDPGRSARHCVICNDKMVARCSCGAPVCNANNNKGKKCFLKHLTREIKPDQWKAMC